MFFSGNLAFGIELSSKTLHNEWEGITPYDSERWLAIDFEFRKA